MDTLLYVAHQKETMGKYKHGLKFWPEPMSDADYICGSYHERVAFVILSSPGDSMSEPPVWYSCATIVTSSLSIPPRGSHVF